MTGEKRRAGLDDGVVTHGEMSQLLLGHEPSVRKEAAVIFREFCRISTQRSHNQTTSIHVGDPLGNGRTPKFLSVDRFGVILFADVFDHVIVIDLNRKEKEGF